MTKKLLAAALAGMLFLSGCGSSDESPGSTAPLTGQDAGAPANGRAQDGKQEYSAEGSAPDAVTGTVVARALIYRGDVTVKVDKVESAAEQVAAIAATAGGFVSSEKRDTGSRESIASVTIRVPSKQFHDTIGRVAQLGEEVSRSTNTEDVTEAVLDLEIRIEAARSSVKAIRELQDKAKTLTDLAAMEREVKQRLEELALLESKKRQVDDLVALSTLTVTLVGPNTVFEVPEEPDPSFLGGLSSGWNAFVATLQVAVFIIGALLPFLAAIAIPVVLAMWLIRRRRRRVPAA